MQRGLIISKSMMKTAVRMKAKPAEAAVAALEILHTACAQTGTYLPDFLQLIAAEMHLELQAQKAAAEQPKPDTKEAE
jgi:hypothetical protein